MGQTSSPIMIASLGDIDNALNFSGHYKVIFARKVVNGWGN